MAIEFRKLGVRVICAIALIYLWSVALLVTTKQRSGESGDKIVYPNYHIGSALMARDEDVVTISSNGFDKSIPIFVAAGKFSVELGKFLESQGFQLGTMPTGMNGFSTGKGGFPVEHRNEAIFMLYCMFDKNGDEIVCKKPHLVGDREKYTSAPFGVRGIRGKNKWKWEILPSGLS